MGKGQRNRNIRKQALEVKKTTGIDLNVKSIARKLRRNRNYGERD